MHHSTSPFPPPPSHSHERVWPWSSQLPGQAGRPANPFLSSAGGGVGGCFQIPLASSLHQLASVRGRMSWLCHNWAAHHISASPTGFPLGKPTCGFQEPVSIQIPRLAPGSEPVSGRSGPGIFIECLLLPKATLLQGSVDRTQKYLSNSTSTRLIWAGRQLKQSTEFKLRVIFLPVLLLSQLILPRDSRLCGCRSPSSTCLPGSPRFLALLLPLLLSPEIQTILDLTSLSPAPVSGHSLTLHPQVIRPPWGWALGHCRKQDRRRRGLTWLAAVSYAGRDRVVTARSQGHHRG